MIQRLRVPLGFVVAAAVLYFATPTGLSILLGFPVALAGAAFRALAAGVIRKDARLATAGPYAWTRNPLYFGTFLLVVGFGIMSGSFGILLLLVIPFGLVYVPVMRREEEHLERLFDSDFREYCGRVPRFFPRFRSSRKSFAFSQYVANREYDAALGFVGVFAVFLSKWLGLTSALSGVLLRWLGY